MKMKNKYDIIIAGGGTAGCACAYTASKLGLKVLLIEKNTFLGGSITSALVIPAMKTSENAINQDFFNILYSKLEQMNGAITYCDENKGWFNPELTKIALDELLLNVGVDILFESKIVEIDKILSGYSVTIHANNNILPLEILSSRIETEYLVDATGNAEICKKLNCKFLENDNKKQPVNLRFIMSGVDTQKFSKWLTEFDSNRNVTTSCIINGITYLSTAYTWDNTQEWALKPLFEDAIDKNILKIDDTNYFQLFSVAGTRDSIAFNCPRIINTAQNPYINGRQSIYRLSNFCKEYFPGFEKAHISSIANSIGIRVSNRIKGKYIYTQQDLKSGKKFKNPVVISNYPIDIHSSQKDHSILERVYQEYQLPIESLIVDDNLFVVGRCLSAEFEAQAALRIIPSCFSMGEGLAKYLVKIIGNSMNVL